MVPAMRSAKTRSGRNDDDLAHDWNTVTRGRDLYGQVEFLDETLREGIQNPSVKDPDVGAKLEILHLATSLGIQAITIGLPVASERAFSDVVRLAQEVVTQRLPIAVVCSGRTMKNDIACIVEVSQRVGLAVEVYAFIGSSPIRALAEDWDLGLLLQRSAEAIDFGVKNGLKVCFVTEDTTRSPPDVLEPLFKNAIDHGATRLCLCDTVGYATPDGVRNLIQFAKTTVDRLGCSHVKIDWHGHNDRGLALSNALFAVECGADRVHATALGIGERVGNTPMELLLLNLKVAGALAGQDLSNLTRYCETVARATNFAVPMSHPLVGRDV